MSDPSQGWIGVDLDGTLAQYYGWKGNGVIGPPVPLMLERVKEWLALGMVVKIVTARAGNITDEAAIFHWCEEHLGQPLPVTDRKDFGMIVLWDDRCVAVEQNTGVVIKRDWPGMDLRRRHKG